MLLSFFISMVLNIPYIFYQIFGFFSKGLFKHEFYYLGNNLLIFCLSLFSILYIYIFILKDFIVSFFVGFETSLLIHTIRIEDFVTFIIFLFTLTLITLIIPYVSMYFFGFRKYFYLLTLFVCALLTPPDIFSLFFMSIPIIILFEIRLLSSYLGSPLI